MGTFFGVERPSEVCQARIEVKLRTPTGRPSPGRPIAVWQGDSDADEADVQEAINKHPSMTRQPRRRKVGYGTDGCTLLARLTFFNSEEVLGKYDIDLLYFPKIRGRPKRLTEFQIALLIAKRMTFEVMKPILADYQNMKNVLDPFYQSIEKMNEELDRTGRRVAKLKKKTKKKEKKNKKNKKKR